MSNSLWPHELQHTRLLCPSLSPGVCWNSFPLNMWRHPLILSSVVPFSSLKSFPASQSFPMNRLFTSGDQSTGASTSASVLPMISLRIDWFNLLAIQGTLKSLLHYHSSKASVLQHSDFFMIQLSHSYMTTGKTIALTIQTFVGKVASLLFKMTLADSLYQHPFCSNFIKIHLCLDTKWENKGITPESIVHT